MARIHTRAKISKSRIRQEQGIYLVEVIVAIMVGAMLTFALLNTAALSLRHSTATQNEVYANTIISQIMEATRATPFDELSNPANIGEHTLLVNKNNSGDAGPSIRTEPLQLNTIDKIWQANSKSNGFPGEVKYTIEDGPVPGTTIKVKVTVSWQDSTRFESKRIVTASTIVSKYGTNPGVD